MEELKTSPNEPEESAPALVAKELDAELNGASAAPVAKTEVHDLTGLVKKKKKNPDTNGAASSNGAAKRKAEDDAEETQSEKKAKLDEAAS